MKISGRVSAFCRHHAGEFLLFLILAAPVVVIRPSSANVLVFGSFFVLYFGLSFWGDIPTRLTADDDGIEYLAGGRDRVFLAWHEIHCVVPRRFRGWQAEDALVFKDAAGSPLLVAGVSMFDHQELSRLGEFAATRVPVLEPVILSPFTGKADGVRRPDLVPQRTSERFLASSIGGLVLAAVLGGALILIVEH